MKLSPTQLRVLYSIVVNPSLARPPGFTLGTARVLRSRKLLIRLRERPGPQSPFFRWIYWRVTPLGIDVLVEAGLCKRTKESIFGSRDNVKQAATCYHDWCAGMEILFGYMLINARCTKCRTCWSGTL